MKRERKTTKIPIGNYPIQTLGRMLLNPSRPSSSELVELHVFYVPEGSWSYKLNTISLEVINEFVSAGFLRVSPQLTLQGLRERLGEFLGEDAVAEKFLFLKCVGNHLAVVKEKQESELKLKSFASPYAFQSELYLLPVMDHLGNVYSEPSAVTLEEQQINDTAEADKTIHRPVNVILSMDEPGGDPSFLNDYPEEAEERVTPKENQTAKNHIGNFEVPGSLEESSGYYSNEQGQLLWKNKDDITINRRQTNQEYEGESVAINTESIKSHQHLDEKEYNTLPDLIDFPSFPFQPVLPSAITDGSLLRIERQKIIEQMKQVREERKYLENVKEELNKKVEKLFEQSKLKRYQACDNWKKKYFETKKVTASLEEVLTKLREDLELYYKKLLLQLEAREIKMRPKNLANISDCKNNLIIQITEVQHAIDQLKRKLDTDKMKLIIEVKMRKQAVSDIRTLKAELTQKKINPTFNTQLGSIGCCNTV